MPGVKPPGVVMLIAIGCGTAMASVCAVGLFQIEHLLGGVWSAAAVATGGAICLAIALAYGRLSEVVPSGVGPLAWLSRAFHRAAGFGLAVPYVLFTLFLVGAETTIAGVLVHALFPIVPPAAAGLVFLGGTWALCRAGIRVGLWTQLLATVAMIAGLVALSVALIARAAERGQLAAALLPPAPSPEAFVSGVGQALFLYMGFELLTSQVEVGVRPPAIKRALVASVVALAGFYILLSLGFSCLGLTAAPQEGVLVPQLLLAQSLGGLGTLAATVALSLLASFTSYNGALLTLSRFTYALAAQKALPAPLARVDPRTLVATTAVDALFAVALVCTAVVQLSGVIDAFILCAALAAALVYGGSLWARERPPFAEAARGRARKLPGLALGGLLALLAVGILTGAGRALAATVGLLALTYGAALFMALRPPPRARARPVPALAPASAAPPSPRPH